MTIYLEKLNRWKGATVLLVRIKVTGPQAAA